jgi:integrase
VHPKVVSEALGHSSTAFAVYVHVMPSTSDLVAAAREEAFGAASGEESGSKP